MSPRERSIDLSDCPSTARKDGPILRLVLGDQLNPDHSWFSQIRHDVVYVMMEVRSETDYVRHHAQKVLAIFAGMRRMAEQLRADHGRFGRLVAEISLRAD